LTQANSAFYISNGTERLRITSAGFVGIGTSSPSELLNVSTTSVADATLIRLDGGAGVRQRFFPSSGTGRFNWQIAAQTNVDNGFEITPSSASGGSTFSTPAITIKSDGKVGIGTTSPNSKLAVSNGGAESFEFYPADASNVNKINYYNRSGAVYCDAVQNAASHQFAIQGTERARIDSSGRLLVGTTTGTSRPGANDMPGRLVFSTTADGASSPTERMRISSTGVVTIQNGAVAVIDTLTDAATITPNFAEACNFTVTLGGNRTIANPTNLTAGQSGSIFLVQDATGSRALSWGSYWDFAGGTAPTLSSLPNAVDRVDYIVRSSTSIHTVFTANYS
jgi:hypothetical protein